MTFSDIDIPISQEAQGAEAFLSSVDQLSVDTLISFGFTEEIARKALKASVSFFYRFNLLRKGIVHLTIVKYWKSCIWLLVVYDNFFFRVVTLRKQQIGYLTILKRLSHLIWMLPHQTLHLIPLALDYPMEEGVSSLFITLFF